MHAAQEAELALRKENIQPVVPLPVHWETDVRLKERQKYDEKMREKQRELEREMAMRRREREEEEEREVRELRKKAVPKAHGVPEWYKEAPKKKKDTAVVGLIDM
jgi:septal ring factor EnvC (AmiA/AmiB activator)